MMTAIKVLLLAIIIFGKVSGRLKRIVGGHDVYLGEIPYQVSLQYDDFFHFCGATVLNKDFVITAGHCVYRKKKEEIRIVMGTVNVKDHTLIYNASWIYVHEKYKIPSRHINDIALIKVHPPIQFNKLVSSVILPQKHQMVSAGTEVLISGWGSVKGMELTLPITMKAVEVTVIDQELCNALYKPAKREVFSTQMCTFEVSSERKGVCAGDSGGPLTLDGVLIGIVSWSKKDPDCASPIYPDVHTRVTEYIDWINEHINE